MKKKWCLCGAVIFIISLVIIGTFRNADDKVNIVEEFQMLDNEYQNITYDEEEKLLFTNNEMLILTEDDVPREELERYLSDYQGKIVEEMSTIKYYRVLLEKEYTYAQLEKLKKEFAESDYIEYAEINPIMSIGTEMENGEKLAYFPTDPWDGDDWNIDKPKGKNWGLEAIKAPVAWEYFSELDTVKIGIMDVMMNTEHEDLEGTSYFWWVEQSEVVNNAILTSDFSSEEGSWYQTRINYENESFLLLNEDGEAQFEEFALENVNPKEKGEYSNDIHHGTHVAGIIGAKWNDVGISGVMGEKAELYLCDSVGTNVAQYKFSNEEIEYHYISLFSYARCIDKLISEGVKVINVSLGFDEKWIHSANDGDETIIKQMEKMSNVLTVYLKRLLGENNDFVICVAAGNENDDRPFKNSYAEYSNMLSYIKDPLVKSHIIVVGAMEKKVFAKGYVYSDFSCVGERVDVVAPGRNIYSCVLDGYDYRKGTSQATPFVTAACGIAYGLNPELTGPEVKELVCSSTEPMFDFVDGRAGALDLAQVAEKAIASRGSKYSKKIETKYNEVGERVQETIYEYDKKGNVVKKVVNDFQNTSNDTLECVYVYNSEGRLAEYYEEKNGERTREEEHVYDENGNRINTFIYKGAGQREVYCGEGRYSAYIGENENIIGYKYVYGMEYIYEVPFYEYDENNRLIRYANLEVEDLYEYDEKGNLVHVTEYYCDEVAGEQVYEYNELNRLCKKAEYSNLKETDWGVQVTGEMKLECWYEYEYME